MTPERLREVISYDPLSGEFTWLVNANRNAGVFIGSVAGAVRRDGYIHIGVDGRRYLASRLAWLYMKGEWPKKYVDHKNRDRRDNRWNNLREADEEQNSWNSGIVARNTSGLKGACWDKSRGAWLSSIRSGKKHKFLGRFTTAAAAHSAYKRACVALRGEFARPE